MKKTTFKLALLATLIVIFFQSCNAGKLNSKAEETANKFYSSIQKKNYESAINLCSTSAFEKDSKLDWRKAFERNAGLLGELVSYTKKDGFDIKASTGNGTLVTLKYDVQWQYGKSLDSIVLEKQKDGSMKVYRYAWDHINAKYYTQMSETEKAANLYMANIESGNYEAALELCSESALKITPKDKWKTFLETANTKLGTISSYTVLKDSSTYAIASSGDAGKGNYYDVFVQTERNGTKVMEKIVFFQKDYSAPLKLTGHFFE